jgi:HD superfamily phosphodiesterase
MKHNDILGIMVKYNGTDVRRINHAIKVYAFAEYIGEKENVDTQTMEIIRYAAILHDIGIHQAEKLYNSSAGNYQEELGSIVAKDLIDNFSIDNTKKERIYFLIGNHHSYNKIDGIDFQILVESDFLVNIFEDTLNIESIKSIKQKIFRTKTGINLLDTMYLEHI